MLSLLLIGFSIFGGFMSSGCVFNRFFRVLLVLLGFARLRKSIPISLSSDSILTSVFSNFHWISPVPIFFKFSRILFLIIRLKMSFLE